MRPLATTFHLASPGGQANRLYALAKRAGLRVHKGDFAFPTVVAKRDGRVIGFLATSPSADAVVAGPFVTEGGRNPILFLRLLESYENVMRKAGVAAYLYRVEERFAPQMVELGFRSLVESDEAGAIMMRKDL